MKQKHPNGFVLLEALVIVAVLSLLVTLFLSASLRHVRSASQDARCLNNLRRLSLGWQMYNADHQNVFPPNDDEGSQPPSPTSAVDKQWCPGIVSSPYGADIAWLKAGLIYPYVGSPSYYRCPADTSTVTASSVYPLGGRGSPRIRSVSMNIWIGAPPNVVNGTIGIQSQYFRVYRSLTDLAVPGPANLFLIADENPYSINDAQLWEQPGNNNLELTTSWVDLPASYHNGSGGISFCDGHAQMRRWTDPVLTNLKIQFPGNVPATPPRTDLLWLMRRSTAHK